MSNVIPNENSWIGFVPGTLLRKFGVTNFAAPTAAEINAAIDVTDYLVNINATTTGNTVPTPRLKSLFETSIPGTAAAQFTGEFYRDDENDLAWLTFPRRTSGSMLIKRFGGTGTSFKPAVGQTVEVWPITVVSRAGSALQSGSAQMFTLTGSVPKEPAEDAIVAA